MIIAVVLFVAAVVVFYAWPNLSLVAVGLVVSGVLLIVARARPSKADGDDAGTDWTDGLADDEWKPCAFSECRAPILRRSRLTYCTDDCARRARRLRNAQTSTLPDDMDIPF